MCLLSQLMIRLRMSLPASWSCWCQPRIMLLSSSVSIYSQFPCFFSPFAMLPFSLPSCTIRVLTKSQSSLIHQIEASLWRDKWPGWFDPLDWQTLQKKFFPSPPIYVYFSHQHRLQNPGHCAFIAVFTLAAPPFPPDFGELKVHIWLLPLPLYLH